MIIAGPCSAESEEQVIATAKDLAALGITHFRAGLWKPRTHPGCFEGVGADGLKWLRKARALTGMKIYTEVACREHLLCAIKGGIDGIWIGARTTANPFAVQEIADTLKQTSPSDLEIWVKNPVNPDIELWIGAIERILRATGKEVGAIHRGFSSYNSGKYRNPPHWAIPIELKRRMPDLKILHDPSHTGGNKDLIPYLAGAAMNLCFDGLMIEVHKNPDNALSDARQQLTPSELADLLNHLDTKQECVINDSMSMLRNDIDAIDAQLVALLGQRMDVCRNIGLLKAEHHIPVVHRERYASLLKKIKQLGIDNGLNEDFLTKIFSTIHEESVKEQLLLYDKTDKI